MAVGFPLGSPNVMNTTGRVASAWGKRVLDNAVSNRLIAPISVYSLDLRVNVGNSGSPVFSTDDLGVIGMVVEASNSPGSGGIAYAVPTTYLIEFLTKNHVSYLTAPEVKPASVPKVPDTASQSSIPPASRHVRSVSSK
jgi:S1-C subfamily serine protease